MLVFELPSAAPVKLRIYDVSGRLVRTLMDGYASPGRHNVVWDGYRNDGRKAGVGVYLYTFRAADHRENGKIFRIR
jgi:flagellar hook assembly protein FlgD